MATRGLDRENFTLVPAISKAKRFPTASNNHFERFFLLLVDVKLPEKLVELDI